MVETDCWGVAWKAYKVFPVMLEKSTPEENTFSPPYL